MNNYGRRIGQIEKPAYGTVITDPFHPLSRGEVLHLLMNEGGGNTAYDISRYSNHGTLMNGPVWGGSKFGEGLKFDESDDSVDIPTAGFNTLSGTLVMWAKPNFNDNVSYYFWDSTGSRFLMYRTDTNNLDVYTDGTYRGSVAYIPANKLTHYAFVYPSNILYINGKEFHDFDDGDLGSIGSTFHMGNRQSYNESFNDIIDSVRIYNRALVAWEIKTLYHDPFCNLLRVPIRRYSVVTAPPAGAIMKQFQKANLGSDLYGGCLST